MSPDSNNYNSYNSEKEAEGYTKEEVNTEIVDVAINETPRPWRAM